MGRKETKEAHVRHLLDFKGKKGRRWQRMWGSEEACFLGLDLSLVQCQ